MSKLAPNNLIMGRPATDFKQIRDVAIVDEFENPDRGICFDAALLKSIVAKHNFLQSDTGDLIPIMPGHTFDDVGELDQPPVVGFAGNLKFGSVGDLEPRPAILADFFILPEMEALFRSMPRRSIEFYEDSGQLGAIAILGGTKPERHLGMLALQHKGNTPKSGDDVSSKSTNGNWLITTPKSGTYWLTATKPINFKDSEVMLNPELIMSILDGEDDVQSKMKKIKAVLVAEAQIKEVVGDIESLPAEPATELAEDDTKDEDETDLEDVVAEVVIPEEEIEEITGAAKLSATKLKSERDQFAIQNKQLKDRLAAVEKSSTATAIALRAQTREAELKQLAYEGYDLDLVDECKAVRLMDDTQYTAHMGRVKKNYRRSPIGSSPIPITSLSALPSSGSNDEEVQKFCAAAKDYALANNMSYLAAKTKLASEQKFDLTRLSAKV
ncbi:hypothetical protein KAR91_20170 [Candidatus Pacearchaeota archaeon]|nr:hypothetical protein [Candidatus Pacearchaeota archaeon]